MQPPMRFSKFLRAAFAGNPACARARPAHCCHDSLTLQAAGSKAAHRPEVAAELAHRLPQLPESERAAVVKLAGGTIGAALRLASDNGCRNRCGRERLIDRQDAGFRRRSLSPRNLPHDDGVDALASILFKHCRTASVPRARLAERISTAGSIVGETRASFAHHALHLEPRQHSLGLPRDLRNRTTRSALTSAVRVMRERRPDTPAPTNRFANPRQFALTTDDAC